MTYQPFGARTRGFSLVELLAVIAIIAILSAMLFPVFAHLRDLNDQQTCMHNENRIGRAVLQYTSDYDQNFPLAQTTNWGANYDWTVMIYPYIQSGTIRGNFTVAGGAFSCPDFPLEPGTGLVENGEYIPLSDIFTDLTQTFTGAPVTPSEIENPAKQIMIYESGLAGPYGLHGSADFPRPGIGNVYNSGAEWVWGDGIAIERGIGHSLLSNCDNLDQEGQFTGDWWDSFAGGGCNVYPRYRHNGHCNMLFVDGHTGAMTTPRLSYANNIYVEAEFENGQNGIGPLY